MRGESSTIKEIVFRCTKGGDQTLLRFTYTNWRGEVAWRRCRPVRVFIGETEHHPGRQFFLEGFDLDREAIRFFAVDAISNIQPDGFPRDER